MQSIREGTRQVNFFPDYFAHFYAIELLIFSRLLATAVQVTINAIIFPADESLKYDQLLTVR